MNAKSRPVPTFCTMKPGKMNEKENYCFVKADCTICIDHIAANDIGFQFGNLDGK